MADGAAGPSKHDLSRLFFMPVPASTLPVSGDSAVQATCSPASP